MTPIDSLTTAGPCQNLSNATLEWIADANNLEWEKAEGCKAFINTANVNNWGEAILGFDKKRAKILATCLKTQGNLQYLLYMRKISLISDNRFWDQNEGIAAHIICDIPSPHRKEAFLWWDGNHCQPALLWWPPTRPKPLMDQTQLHNIYNV